MKLFSKIQTAGIIQVNDVAEVKNEKISLPDFTKVLLTLTLLGLSINFFHIEEGLRLFELMKVVIPGFIIYAFLPLRLRMPFFFVLNIVALLVLFGITTGLSILVISLMFIGITALPVEWKYRALLVLLATVVLILFRVEFLVWGNSTQVITIVGILIMFRSILYMYELQYEKKDPGIWKRINYFLLIPNLIFYIFPIVDYKTFVRNYYDKPAFEQYSKGLKWMFTGITHFLIYRILYYYFMPDLYDIDDIYGLIQYMGISYALIIRLSGIFHFSAGVICLFGFNLPETFSNYFLATNFSDLWRRINIYWKDFVMKIFYFPIYFKFKKRNNTAVFITVLIVFFFNWFLHAYQWFWIRGTFLLKDTDILFWASLGVLVAINSVYQKNTKRKVTSSGFDLKAAFIDSGKIIGMFIMMSFLWGFWISPSLIDWWNLITGIIPVTTGDIFYILSVVFCLLLIGAGLHYLYYEYAKRTKFTGKLNTPHLYVVNITLLLLVLLGNPFVSQKIGNELSFDVEPILTTKLNQADQEQLFKGYYDELIVGNNFNSQMWEVEQNRPADWGNLKSTGIFIPRNDMLTKNLKPNEQITFKNKIFTTNVHGQRDKLYQQQKPEGYLRIALLGGSIEVGSGVGDDETFENILEEKLNKNRFGKKFDAVEVINFSMSGIHMPQHVYLAENEVKYFNPDLLIYTAHTNEVFRSLNRFASIMADFNIIQPYPYLRTLYQKLNLRKGMPESEVMELLGPYENELYEWGLGQIARTCQNENIQPVLVYLQALGDKPKSENEYLEIKSMAEKHGFYFIDLHDIFDNVDTRKMIVAYYDRHPNATGHKLIAQKLYNIFQTDKDFLQLIEKVDAESE